MGRVSTRSPVRSRKRSGEALAIAASPQIEVGGERRGILQPEAEVELEGRFDDAGLQALREVGLEDVAREDVLAGPRHHAQELLAREGGNDAGQLSHGVRRRPRPTGCRRASACGYRRGGEALSHHRRARFGAGGSRRALLLRQARGEEPRPSALVIPGKRPVVEAEAEVGQIEIVEARRGQFLEVMAKVVRKKPRGAALERR